MNKNKMIIAVFAALVSAAVSARAAEGIDFDGKNAKAVNFAEALKSDETVKTDAIKFAKLTPAELQEIPGRAAPEFTEAQVKEMDKSIGTAIAYVREQKLPGAFAGSFTCLLQKGTPAQKAEFVYLPEGAEYSFPGVCRDQNKGICTWVTQKVCDMVMDPKTNISKLVCTAAKVFVCNEVDVEPDPPTSGH